MELKSIFNRFVLCKAVLTQLTAFHDMTFLDMT